MSSMFYKEAVFNRDISSWDVRKVTNMQNMFHSATKFNQLLTSWVLKKIDSFQGLFHIFESSGMTKKTYCTILNEGDPKWKEQKDNLGLDYTCE